MSETEYTLHSSLFDVVRTITLEISSDVNADSDYSAPVEGIGFEVPAVSAPDFGSLVMGLPPVVSIANPTLNAATAEYLVFHKSVFGIYQDREVTIESSCVVNSDFVYPVIQIHEYPESVAHPLSEIAAEEFCVFAQYSFDIWKQFYATFAVQSVVPSVSDVSPVCCVSAELVAQTIISIADYPYLPVGQTITGNSDIVASSDVNIGRGDFDVDCSLVAASIGITAEYVAANKREIKFGSFVLPHSERKTEDSIKPIYNDRFNRLSNVNGVFSRPRAYERTITIHGETNKRIEYDQLHDQIGPKKALYVYGFYFPDCELTGLDIKQTKPGLDRYPYTATFIQRVFDTQDSASFAGLEFSNVVSVGDIKKTRISDDKYAKAGISEPRAYQASVEIDCITEYPDEYSNAESRMGSIGNLIINGNTYRNAIITDISGIQQVGGGNAWSYTVSFNWFVFSVSDSVSLGSVTLPNIIEVSDEKRTPILDDRFSRAGISEPKAYQSDWTVSGVFTTDTQFNAVDALIGSNLTITINGKTYADTRISDISINQYRGGGSVRAYTISLTRYQFNTSDIVTFDNIGMQNVLTLGNETRTPIIDERISRAGLSEPTAYQASCQAEIITTNASEYSLIESRIGKSATLKINGNTYANAKLTDLSKAQPRGGGNVWIYSVSFNWFVFSANDSVTIDGIVLQNIVSVGDENKSPILTDSFTQKGISEPVAFSISRNIEFVDESGSVLSAIESIVGKSITAIINRTTHQKCKIAGISRYQPRGGGINVISIDLIRYQYNTTDTVVFNGLTLSNPTIPNAMDITPSYSADMSAGMNLSNGVPKISRRFAAECITESTTEFETLVASIGIRGTLNYNGKSYNACYISMLSALQPRGGGSIWSYTIEFSRESGVVPVYASFNRLTLPNAILQSETPEILKSRTTLHNGKIAVDLGVYPSRSITLSCMSNSKSEYDTLYSWIGAKLALNVDGMVIRKAYIADLPAVRICGEGNTRLYTFDVTFEEETA